MGKDIRGWVEVQRYYKRPIPPYDNYNTWYGIITVSDLLNRNYDMFSSLFGGTFFSFAQFRPIAADRGLPKDISEQASDDYLTWDCALGETWISWQETQEVDWDEQALDGRPHEYEVNDTGKTVYKGKSAPQAMDIIEEGNSWQVGASLFKIEKVSRRESLTRDWQLLFRLMRELAADYGDDNVRLVVWFDY